MLRIGLTGGMGCGKSTIAHAFSVLGIPVYKADAEAKRISGREEVRRKIIETFGKEAADNPKCLAKIVFSQADKLARLNAIVHPLVFEDCIEWFASLEKRDIRPPYAIVEAAILFESGMDRLFDRIIDVEAPIDEQIARCRKRDNCDAESIRSRLSNQMRAEERMKRSDFVIRNGKNDEILPLVLDIDRRLRGIDMSD